MELAIPDLVSEHFSPDNTILMHTCLPSYADCLSIQNNADRGLQVECNVLTPE